jgi:glycosyltransferase involved in cell wall biosynthesis
LPSVLLLAESLRRVHPEILFTALFVDAANDDEFRDLPFEVMRPRDLEIEPDEFARMATYYDITELSTSLKPTLLRQLLADAEVVLYLDPDIEVFGALHPLLDGAREHEIALTPHVLTPMPRDGLEIAEETILLSGQFNLGCIAVSRCADPFLDYWEARVRRHAVVDIAVGYFTDQRWVDAVPSLFRHQVCRDTGCNVAYWNLHERELSVDDEGTWSVDGHALRFFHFSGHDDREPFVLTRHLRGEMRVRVDQQPALRRLLRERSERMRDARRAGGDPPYRWGRTDSGLVLDHALRRTYWAAVLDADATGRRCPPSAFDAGGGEAFVDWCNARLGGSGVSRHLLGYWNTRPDLQGAFPDPLGASAGELVRWASDDSWFVEQTPMALRPSRPTGVMPGINLVGYLAGEFGVGSAARIMSRLIRGAGLPLAASKVHAEGHRNTAQPVTTVEGAPFELSVIMVNADMLPDLWRQPEMAPHHHRRRVGVWYWEVGILPESARAAFDLVDEVWCASDYVRRCLEPYASCPVFQHPLALTPTIPTALTRADLGLPEDRFLFGFGFDYMSVVERKNPEGLVQAYRSAFGPDDGATLVLKTIHAESYPHAAARVREAAAGRDDILFVDGFLTPLEMRAFFQLLDAYVSLHRAEGLGLTIASAMAAGVPTVATGWSGNLEFMDDANSVLVPYVEREIGPGAGPYPPEATWAEPDLVAAADAMRHLFDDRTAARRLGERARRDLAAFAEHGVGADWLGARYDALIGSKVA